MPTIAELATTFTSSSIDDEAWFAAQDDTTTGKIDVAGLKVLFAPTSGTFVTPTTLNNASLPASVTTLAASGSVTFTATAASSSPSTGALVVAGGVGVSGAVYTAGHANFGNGSVQGTAATFKGDGTTSAFPGQVVIQSTASPSDGQFIDMFNAAGVLQYRQVSYTGSLYFQQGTSFTTRLFIRATDGNIGVNLTNPLSRMDVAGNLAVGSYAGVVEAPANGMIISGDVGIGTSTPAAMLDVNGTIRIANGVSFSGTVTSPGTTGNQTINKATGTVNIAASGTTVTVTNSLVTLNSIVTAVLRTNDATARIANVVPAAGSFTINLTAAATAETSVGFVVINP